MKSVKFYLPAVLFFCSINIAHAENKIYHWVDEQGKNHFSDTATANAEEISINQQNLLLDNQSQTAKIETTAIVAIPSINYQATITSPLDDSALRSNDGSIEIQVEIIPQKKNEQKLQLFLDGKALGAAQISTTIRALNIDRGTHQLQVQLLDKEDKLLAKTQIVTIHLLRATVGMIRAKVKGGNQ